MSRTLTPFEQKALGDLALSLVDHHADREALPEHAEAVAALLGCSTAELFAYMQRWLTGIMSYPRSLDIFDQPMIDQGQAAEILRRCRHDGGHPRIWFARGSERRLID